MDVELFAGQDGGEIRIDDGQIVMTGGPWTAIYLSLFGGNVDDNGTTATTAREYWGNKLETDPARRLRSKTQNALISLPAIPANARALEELAAADVAWLLESGLVKTIEISVSMPALNRARFAIHVETDAESEDLQFDRPWGAT